MFQVPSASLDIASDFAILVLPLPRICRLQLTIGKKFGICAIFSVGCFACIASIACLVSAINILRITEDDLAFPFAMDRVGLWR